MWVRGNFGRKDKLQNNLKLPHIHVKFYHNGNKKYPCDSTVKRAIQKNRLFSALACAFRKTVY